VNDPRANQRLSSYLTVGEAAEVLGVSPWTLRNWDRAGRLRPRRHPKNGYRLYRREDLEAVLRATEGPAQPGAATDDAFGWAGAGESEHFVQFYETDAFLARAVGEYVGAALGSGDAAVVVATPAHRRAIRRKLRERGLDVPRAVARGRYVALDAAGTLARFMTNGAPDAARFAEVVGGVVARAARAGRRVRAFGEMVALLWEQGNRNAAVRLEGLWNDLRKAHTCSLFCAYPIACFHGPGCDRPFDAVCACHARVIPAESYSALRGDRERLAAVSGLQQRVGSLEVELASRGPPVSRARPPAESPGS